MADLVRGGLLDALDEVCERRVDRQVVAGR
jgi:hypothetical protein